MNAEDQVRLQENHVKNIEIRLRTLRWKKSQNSNHLASKIQEEREIKENDTLTRMMSRTAMEEERSRREKSVLREELSRPLGFGESGPSSFLDLYKMELKQRKEYERFDIHLKSIRKAAKSVARRHRAASRRAGSPLRNAGKTSLELEKLNKMKARLTEEKRRCERSIRRLVQLQKG